VKAGGYLNGYNRLCCRQHGLKAGVSCLLQHGTKLILIPLRMQVRPVEVSSLAAIENHKYQYKSEKDQFSYFMLSS
jgi:hypothetical protein